MSLHKPTFYQHKVDVYCRLFDGVYKMDRDTLELTFRFLISAAIMLLVFQGDMPGVYGGLFVTIIMGIDFAAFFEAWRQTRNSSTQKTFEK